MIEKIEPWIKGKRILLLGYGREGQSTWNVLRRLGTYEALDIADLKAPAALPEDGTVWHTGPDYQKCMDDYDVVFKSPGIVLERPENEYRCSILSQTEVFFQCFRDQIIGITGTKGKSTVTTLLYHLLKQAGMDVKVTPVSTAEYTAAYPGQAKRPMNSRISKEKLLDNGFERLPSWQDAVGRYLKEIQ